MIYTNNAECEIICLRSSLFNRTGRNGLVLKNEASTFVNSSFKIKLPCDSCRIQTCNLLIRSQMLYSVELMSHFLFASAKVHFFIISAKHFCFFLSSICNFIIIFTLPVNIRFILLDSLNNENDYTLISRHFV